MSSNDINWTRFLGYFRQRVSVIGILSLFLLLDLCVSLSASLFVSDTFYFRSYLAGGRYSEIVEDYYKLEFYVQPDQNAGWTNTPNLRTEGEWNTDALGSRISPQQQPPGADADINNAANLVLLLGSSVINGYGLDYSDTPVGHLKQQGHSAYDFSSVMYTIDQSFELFRASLAKYRPRVVVVGIHNDLHAISNMFAPFRDHNVSSPFLKPAYFMSGSDVVRVNPPVDHQQQGELQGMLAKLEKHDSSFYRFDYYRRLSLLPFSDLLRRGMLKVQNEMLGLDEYRRAFQLQKHFMTRFAELAEAGGGRAIFVKFDRLKDQYPPLHKRWLGDRNAEHTQMLKETSMNVLYLAEMFRDAEQPVTEFYENDGVHLSADGSALLAQEINRAIRSTARKQ